MEVLKRYESNLKGLIDDELMDRANSFIEVKASIQDTATTTEKPQLNKEIEKFSVALHIQKAQNTQANTKAKIRAKRIQLSEQTQKVSKTNRDKDER